MLSHVDVVWNIIIDFQVDCFLCIYVTSSLYNTEYFEHLNKIFR